jgi:hypothetical protein
MRSCQNVPYSLRVCVHRYLSQDMSPSTRCFAGSGDFLEFCGLRISDQTLRGPGLDKHSARMLGFGFGFGGFEGARTRMWFNNTTSWRLEYSIMEKL